MKCVIISEEKVIDLGKRCLSNLRDFVNNEYNLEYNDVKRLKTLYFMTCKKVFVEQQKSKENNYFILENINEVLNEKIKEKYPIFENINEVWNEKIEEKYWEAVKYVKKSKAGDESKVEEVFNTPVCNKYSRKEFSLEETARIFSLIEDGLNRCHELNEDLFRDIKDFEYIYEVYNFRYNSLDRF